MTYTFLPLDPEESASREASVKSAPTSTGPTFGQLPWSTPQHSQGTIASDWRTLATFRGTAAFRNRLPAIVYRIADYAVLISALTGALIATNLGEMPRGVDEFLAIRMSLKNILLLAAFLGFWRLNASLLGLYTPDGMRRSRTEAWRILIASALASIVCTVFPLTSASGAFNYVSLALFAIGLPVALLAGRALLRALAASQPKPTRDVLIVGTGPRALEMTRRLAADHEVAWRIAGFLDSRTFTPPTSTAHGIAAQIEQLPNILLRVPIDEVIVALPVRSQYTVIQDVVGLCESVGVPVTVPADFFRTHRISLRPMPFSSLLALRVARPLSRWKLLLKRCIDVFGAMLALVLLGPLMMVTAAAIKLSSRGPVLYTQERYGYGRRVFRMYKFRTMVENAEALQPSLEHLNEASGPLFKIHEDPRITRLGRLLRHTSIDELPQLFNVLSGEMSLVGPRPMAIRDVHQFPEAWLMRRFSVMPGMTGLWQVSGRAALGYEQWAALDLRYIDEWSLLLDLKLLLRTIPAVLAGTGAD
jgi:exopolysaccharide biosynthesis polyprenyl glycosylphosphotransferase